MKRYLKHSLLLFTLLFLSGKAYSQNNDTRNIDIDDSAYKLDTIVAYYNDTIVNHAVLVNKFWDNWFVSVSGGAHYFMGDYHKYGSFKDGVSPRWFVGLGKWFTPSIGAKLEFGLTNSKGFADENKSHTSCYLAYGDKLFTKDGIGYYRTKVHYWIFNTSIMLNISRMIAGYEGIKEYNMMNQFIVELGLGFVHNYKFEQGEPKKNEWDGKIDLQYSRYLTKKKAVSLDVFAGMQFFPTNFDGNYDFVGCQNFDYNWFAGLGLTYYFKNRYWSTPSQIKNQTTYKLRDINTEIAVTPTIKTLSFYVFYPDGGEYDLKTVATNVDNSTNSLSNLKGYKTTESGKLYSFTDVYAAATGNSNGLTGVNDAAVRELQSILKNETIMKVTAMSMTDKIDYYTSNVNEQQENSKNIKIANTRVNDVLSLLKTHEKVKSITPNIMLVNEMDVNKENCVKVTIQYVSFNK